MILNRNFEQAHQLPPSHSTWVDKQKNVFLKRKYKPFYNAFFNSSSIPTLPKIQTKKKKN